MRASKHTLNTELSGNCIVCDIALNAEADFQHWIQYEVQKRFNSHRSPNQ